MSLLDAMHSLIKFSQLKYAFVCDFVIKIKFLDCQIVWGPKTLHIKNYVFFLITACLPFNYHVSSG